ncbi:sugar phosphate isomerase/epimerase [Membranicola marinus]|uniref:Sugar phosphate isomerase/epimerase n=1 Tax=Membranihabitans marinus TaxID=1227546 RepID=A0A953L7P7_9BACT|nr:sugar phosphate isomerase/epimerase [Membranihabitans marinus]MBY5956835.1 sugar phosphate isomerase/epimerase [Membranihabitans marinus]
MSRSNRRQFLKQAGLLTGGLATIPALSYSCQSRQNTYPQPGLQLFTVREAMDKDPEAALARVAELGYKEMETASYSPDSGFYGMDIDRFREVLKRNGLNSPSGHYGFGAPDKPGSILGTWEVAVEDASKLGIKYMVCPMLSYDDRQTLDDYKFAADAFNKAGETCKSAGIQFCYHNHAFEFDKIDGQVPYDILLNATDPDLVKMEIDIYWVRKAGLDPVAMINAHPGRFPLWHVKDMDDTPDQGFAEVGHGVIDWTEIFPLADKSGLEYYFVEQDRTAGSPFDSIKKSITYLNNHILK